MIGPFFILFGLMLIGFLAVKLTWLNEIQNQGLGNVLINIAFPCLMFASIAKVNIEDDLLIEFSKAAILSFVLFFGFGFLGKIYTRLTKVPKEYDPMVRLSLLTSNNGFMGFPITIAFFGQAGLMLMVANNLAMSIVVFSYGVNILKKSKGNGEGNSFKEMLNPMILSILFAFFINLLGFSQHIPGPLFDLISLLGDLATPLSMLYIGGTLAMSPMKDLFYNRLVLGVSITRLTVFAAIAFFFLKWLPISSLMKQILFLVCVLPSAAAVPVVTERYGQGHKESVNIVVMSTLLSVIATPLGVYLSLKFF